MHAKSDIEGNTILQTNCQVSLIDISKICKVSYSDNGWQDVILVWAEFINIGTYDRESVFNSFECISESSTKNLFF